MEIVLKLIVKMRLLSVQLAPSSHIHEIPLLQSMSLLLREAALTVYVLYLCSKQPAAF